MFGESLESSEKPQKIPEEYGKILSNSSKDPRNERGETAGKEKAVRMLNKGEWWRESLIREISAVESLNVSEEWRRIE